MHNTRTIAARQFRSYFNSPAAYIVVCLFLFVLGMLFWPQFFLMGRASVRDLFQHIPPMMLAVIPAITMGLIAEERRTGTLELLLTMPVRDAEVILGKFLGAFGLYAVMLGLTLLYPVSVSTLGKLDWGQVWAGYFGLILQGAAMISLGLLASSWTSNQLIAFFVGGFLCLIFWILDSFLPFFQQSMAGAVPVVQWLSLNYHFTSMARGVVDSRDVIYFVSLSAFSLGLAFRALESRKWR
jgi:ABC-2 type transport system permease protein